jgi:hypothetical protein
MLSGGAGTGHRRATTHASGPVGTAAAARTASTVTGEYCRTVVRVMVDGGSPIELRGPVCQVSGNCRTIAS